MVEQIKRINDMVKEAIEKTPLGITFKDPIHDYSFTNEEMSCLRMTDVYYTFRIYVHGDRSQRVYIDWNTGVYPDGINFDDLEQEAKTFLDGIAVTSETQWVKSISQELESINKRRDELNKRLEQWQNQQ